MSLSRKFATTIAALSTVALLAGCAGNAGGDTGTSGAESADTSTHETVRIGVVNSGYAYWATYQAAASAEGITIDLVNFNQYEQPNPALAAGELELNQFQHIVYLAQHNVGSGDDLVPIGSTAIYPLSLYSLKYESVEEIPDGETIAIPNDPSNQARALLVLQSAGLVALTDGGSIFSTLADIDDANSRVEISAIDPSLTATSLPDVAAAIINNDFVEGAGLDPLDTLAGDDPSDPNAIPYVNVFAARADQADNPTYAKLVEIYQNTTAVTDGVIEAAGGTGELVVTPVEELQESLATVEEDVRAHQ